MLKILFRRAFPILVILNSSSIFALPSFLLELAAMSLLVPNAITSLLIPTHSLYPYHLRAVVNDSGAAVECWQEQDGEEGTGIFCIGAKCSLSPKARCNLLTDQQSPMKISSDNPIHGVFMDWSKQQAELCWTLPKVPFSPFHNVTCNAFDPTKNIVKNLGKWTHPSMVPPQVVFNKGRWLVTQEVGDDSDETGLVYVSSIGSNKKTLLAKDAYYPNVELMFPLSALGGGEAFKVAVAYVTQFYRSAFAINLVILNWDGEKTALNIYTNDDVGMGIIGNSPTLIPFVDGFAVVYQAGFHHNSPHILQNIIQDSEGNWVLGPIKRDLRSGGRDILVASNGENLIGILKQHGAGDIFSLPGWKRSPIPSLRNIGNISQFSFIEGTAQWIRSTFKGDRRKNKAVRVTTGLRHFKKGG